MLEMSCHWGKCNKFYCFTQRFFDNKKFTNCWVFSNQCCKRMQQLNIATVNSHCCMGHACGRTERSLIVNDHKVISDAY